MQPSGGLGSFCFDSVDERLGSRAELAGLFGPLARPIREDSAANTMWSMPCTTSPRGPGCLPSASQQSAGKACLPPAASEMIPRYGDMSESYPASSFLHCSRRGRLSGHQSVPNFFAEAGPSSLGVARNSQSSMDIAMESVFGESDGEYESSEEDVGDGSEDMSDSALELDTYCVSSPTRNHNAQTPTRASTASCYDVCCSPGEQGGLLYIQSPPSGKFIQAQSSRRILSVFLPRGTKILHLVRHGESTYNAACGAPGSSWEDPTIFDARLTEHGQQQASAVGPKLRTVSDKALWVSSPLTRAIQTCVLARQGRDGDHPTGNWLTLRPELAEHLMTTGDVGRPRSILQRDFPEATEAFDGLDEQWWFSGQQGRNCALRGVMGCPEPKSAFQARVMLFRKWVLSQEAPELVVFGHSTFFKELMGGDRRLANCEVFTFRL